ncbi:sensor histidine kinase [Streptomyces sp. NPDC059894]|uniref:sensor histidine kinase n=1 Tax=unclassified Streptomyces TaxID=2593676 RepID=UPI00364D0883
MPATASDPATGPRRPRRTVRLRLTLLYGGLFLVCGVALLAITYLLVAGTEPELFMTEVGNGGRLPEGGSRPQVVWHWGATLRLLVVESAIALGIMSVVAVGLGWIMAGRALRPVRIMTDRALRISERNLHERLAVAGPHDELKVLGDTFDRLLGRLDTAFETQKRFVANASHELRTPLTLQRVALEVALTDPDRDVESLEEACQEVLAYGEHQERMIEALLTLAGSERGLEYREPVDLARIAEAVLDTPRPQRGVRIERSLGPAVTHGDPRLLERLVANLVDNAVRHNLREGWVRVTTSVRDHQPLLRVVNSGPHVPHDRIDDLFTPFQRLESRTGGDEGHGLGLSIVAAIATAHDAESTTRPGPEGGLDISMTFPAPPAGGAS